MNLNHLFQKLGLKSAAVVWAGLRVGQWLTVRITQIKPAEVLVWKWENVYSRSTLVSILGLGLYFGLGLGFALGAGLYVRLGVGLGVGLVLELYRGWSIGMLDTSKLSKPNQGIWHSARNGVRSGLGVGLVGGLGFGLIFGLVFGLKNGGEACIQHVTLRLILRGHGRMPWRYAAFLDYASDCILLRKVGGGYRFIHRLLLDYFADLAPSVAPATG